MIDPLEARDDLLLELFESGDSRCSDEIPHLRVLGNDYKGHAQLGISPAAIAPD